MCACEKIFVLFIYIAVRKAEINLIVGEKKTPFYLEEMLFFKLLWKIRNWANSDSLIQKQVGEDR